MWCDEILDEYVSGTSLGVTLADYLGAWSFTALGATGVWIAMLLSNALTVLYGHIIYKTKDWSALHYAKGEQS